MSDGTYPLRSPRSKVYFDMYAMAVQFECMSPLKVMLSDLMHVFTVNYHHFVLQYIPIYVLLIYV